MILLSPIEMGPSSSPRVIDFQVAQKRRDLEKIPTSLGGAIILTIWRGPFTADALRHVVMRRRRLDRQSIGRRIDADQFLDPGDVDHVGDCFITGSRVCSPEGNFTSVPLPNKAMASSTEEAR